MSYGWAKDAEAVSARRTALAEDIVRALADIGVTYDHEYGDCILCEKLSRSDPVAPQDHDPTCTWRRAREWVAAVDGHVVVTDPAVEAKT